MQVELERSSYQDGACVRGRLCLRKAEERPGSHSRGTNLGQLTYSRSDIKRGIKDETGREKRASGIAAQKIQRWVMTPRKVC